MGAIICCNMVLLWNNSIDMLYHHSQCIIFNICVIIMNLENKIKEILSIPQSFFMFKGGAGGEFLTHQISIFSNKFKNQKHDLNEHRELNRTMLVYPKFYRDMISSCPSDTPSYNLNKYTKINIENSLATILNQRYNEQQLNDMFIEVDEYFKDCTNPLFRLHPIINQYFNNKTYYLFQDKHIWFKYANILSTLKNTIAVDIIKHHQETEHHRNGIEIYNIDPYLEEINKLNVSRIPLLTVMSIFNKDISKEFNSPKELINVNIKDLFDKYENKFFGNHEAHTLQCNFVCNKFYNYKQINFSNCFNKGYLEDIFEINSNQFYYYFRIWHEKNLELMSANGFDFREFTV
jgi:hypothetical protein